MDKALFWPPISQIWLKQLVLPEWVLSRRPPLMLMTVLSTIDRFSRPISIRKSNRSQSKAILIRLWREDSKTKTTMRRMNPSISKWSLMEETETTDDRPFLNSRTAALKRAWSPVLGQNLLRMWFTSALRDKPPLRKQSLLKQGLFLPLLKRVLATKALPSSIQDSYKRQYMLKDLSRNLKLTLKISYK